MNNEYGNPISFYIAEVVSAFDKETYTLKTQRESTETTKLHHAYEISCKIITPDTYSPVIHGIKPADINSKKIPVVGEQVLIFIGYREDSNIDSPQPAWYYLTTLSINSNINFNALTGLSNSSITTDTFIDKEISILQAYEGDTIIEGRWGNSIRFGSSIDTSKAKVEVLPNYLGDLGHPIIILSNRNKTTTNYITEDVNSDYSSLYLTSNQRINNLTTNNPVSPNTISISNFSNSQLIGVADRIILKSKTDSIIIDGKQSVEINAPTIYLGSSTDKEPLLHSDAVVKLLQKLVAIVKIGFQDSSGVVCTPLYDSLPDTDLEILFKELTNDNIQVDAYKNNTLNT